ncbi:hypothetical protein DIPPA_32189 [Diplonema papillatum]|nr:hypothetical protein DIPPA_32189 [Diplonema papillatum]
MLAKELEQVRKYLLSRVADAFLVAYGPDGPALVDYLKSIEQDMYGNPSDVNNIEGFLRGSDADGNPTPPTIFFTMQNGKVATTTWSFELKNRIVVAFRNTPCDDRGRHGRVSSKEADMINEIHLQLVDVVVDDPDAPGAAGGKVDKTAQQKGDPSQRMTYLDYHRYYLMWALALWDLLSTRATWVSMHFLTG